MNEVATTPGVPVASETAMQIRTGMEYCLLFGAVFGGSGPEREIMPAPPLLANAVETRVKTPLRVLMVEESDRDADLVLVELRRGFDVDSERVDTAEAMGAALDRRTWDIIFCASSIPPFDAKAALSLTRERGFDL